ncbi:hypothetical protein D1BOALGB6SA_10502 [Olavius sp. associated proteobacterium Delta 1]|nr:hypothetical protein D1BOALGB6SA_10502 [Olavius sp. associated proteobacterium Delta 1]
MSLQQVFARYYEDYLFNENRENPKHQKSNIKQIPMTKFRIRNS